MLTDALFWLLTNSHTFTGTDAPANVPVGLLWVSGVSTGKYELVLKKIKQPTQMGHSEKYFLGSKVQTTLKDSHETSGKYRNNLELPSK